METKKTSVEWLMENLHTAKDPFTQAKEMEKQQILIAYNEGFESYNCNPEHYYTDTYNS